jgi:hypothetical protein
MSNLAKYGMKQCDACCRALVPDDVKYCAQCIRTLHPEPRKIIKSKLNTNFKKQSTT